jgi:hypothetical protein
VATASGLLSEGDLGRRGSALPFLLPRMITGMTTTAMASRVPRLLLVRIITSDS